MMSRKTFDLREQQDMIQEMNASMGEHTYWEGKYYDMLDLITNGHFSNDQLNDFADAAKKRVDSDVANFAESLPF